VKTRSWAPIKKKIIFFFHHRRLPLWFNIMLPHIFQKSTGTIKKFSPEGGRATRARQSGGTLFCVLDAAKKSLFVSFWL
jgi:hypothetical protein